MLPLGTTSSSAAHSGELLEVAAPGHSGPGWSPHLSSALWLCPGSQQALPWAVILSGWDAQEGLTGGFPSCLGLAAGFLPSPATLDPGDS